MESGNSRITGGSAQSAVSEWLALGDAARYLGVAQSTVRSWADSGRLDTFKTPGGHRRFRREDLDRFMNGAGAGQLPPSRYGGAPMVLIIDDDSAVRAVIRECLERDGFLVSEGGNATEAVTRINERIPDLLLLDVMMPGVDGWELLRRLREKLDVKELPVVVFSGQVDMDELSAPSRGAQGFFRKPFDPGRIVAQVKALLGTKA